MTREDWQKTWLVAGIWWCGDEVCDCTQPIVERVTPNTDAGYPWVRRERIWEGQFCSEATDGETIGQWKELREAMQKYQIPDRAGSEQQPWGQRCESELLRRRS